MMTILTIYLLLIVSATVNSFQRSFLTSSLKSTSLSRHYNNNALLDYVADKALFLSSIQICDTSISEEEVLEVSGQVTNLPDPLIAVAFAAVVFLGVAILQFSLGDLTKEVLNFFMYYILYIACKISVS